MLARLPNFKHIKRNIQRQRKKKDLSQGPQEKTFTMIPKILTITLRKDTFLQFDSGPGDNRLVIFASVEQLKLLEDTKEILIDGTFKITPLIFAQLYTTHGVYRNDLFPLIFALLRDKQQQSYKRSIKELCHLCPAWNSDLKAIMKLTRNLLMMIINKISALAFFKSTEVHQGYDELYLSLPPIFQPLMDYFEDIYVGRRRPNGRATPKCPVELWNIYQRTLDDSMRTNNLAESWHRTFSSVVQFQHPSLWIFIQSLKKRRRKLYSLPNGKSQCW
ncbi:unnamed protein product [Rotaria magnacalcarata]|uniref:MULE transposase domain-containing protein n=1 Tax=Rotaria magnacalcarata TaxID=392030 RepID=A0A817ALH8_9BILA|nr:unnamed protein product [Rotaria magnacalcarata]